MKFRLAAEYECYPTWSGEGEHFKNVDPATLPVPGELIRAFTAWGQRHEATYDRADPVASGFPSPEAEAAFDQEGRRLRAALARALGPEHVVVYFSVLHGWESVG